MKRPHFKSCNHGCAARKATGQATNGRCDFPRLDKLRETAGVMWGYHDDAEVRKFGRDVVTLLEHIYEEEESAVSSQPFDGQCTRPEDTDCHARAGKFCMNGFVCNPNSEGE